MHTQFDMYRHRCSLNGARPSTWPQCPIVTTAPKGGCAGRKASEHFMKPTKIPQSTFHPNLSRLSRLGIRSVSSLCLQDYLLLCCLVTSFLHVPMILLCMSTFILPYMCPRLSPLCQINRSAAEATILFGSTATRFRQGHICGCLMQYPCATPHFSSPSSL